MRSNCLRVKGNSIITRHPEVRSTEGSVLDSSPAAQNDVECVVKNICHPEQTIFCHPEFISGSSQPGKEKEILNGDIHSGRLSFCNAKKQNRTNKK